MDALQKLICVGTGLGLIVVAYTTITNRHISKHLDSKAIHLEECPEHFKHRLTYKDTDDDGDYESFLLLSNSDYRTIPVPIEKDSEGKIILKGIDEHAVIPPNVPHMKSMEKNLPLDYSDIDEDGKLESIVCFNNGKDTKMYKIEIIDGNYIFSSIDSKL